ncbi:TonB-dependent receptor plug domain-containing protein [Agaribacterium haliotis]|uniref:TonB-dependent receptor plug domain-containing protein n=1 Tax=Agaribacterium haliotis TaxID=2013869 RepID=UPI0013040164|nr:TonB-dependent receptor [Agaribacterium haliotis]
MLTYLLSSMTLSPISAFAAQNLPENLFDLSLEQLLAIEVDIASNLNAPVSRQPASISTITEEDIRLSGARTLNELLTMFVPGYFMVEDQDDSIAAFRGLVADNNSKVQLLLNGQKLNAEWFWGAPDAVLNGLDLNYIARVEVVRGPGSVTQGQGALLGLINIVTRSPLSSGFSAKLSRGKDEYEQNKLELSYLAEQWHLHAYLSEGGYDGQLMPNKGWAEAYSEQGLTVVERQHHLKRADYTNVQLQLGIGAFELAYAGFDQRRDLYNFFRDREQVEQKLQLLSASYERDLSTAIAIQLDAHMAQDDYALYSHGGNLKSASRLSYEQSVRSDIDGMVPVADASVAPGLRMGGAREERQGFKGLVQINLPEQKLNMAAGLEYMHFSSGRLDQKNSNFILNDEIQTLGLESNGNGGFSQGSDVNLSNRWVKPYESDVLSLFFEGAYQLSEAYQLFAAFRYDKHPEWGAQLSPRLGAFYSPSSEDLFRLSWQRGFRGAVGVQYAGGYVQDGLLAESSFSAVNDISTTHADFDWDGIAANDDKTLLPTSPETIDSVELAYTREQQKWRFSSVLFYNSVKDILTAEAHGYEGLAYGDKVGDDLIASWGGNWYYQNQQGRLDHIGAELEAQLQGEKTWLSFSHAYVDIVHADPGTLGIYARPGNKIAAYPQNVSRAHLRYKLPWSFGALTFTSHYNHLRYWGYSAPNGASMPGANVANLGLGINSQLGRNLFAVDFIVKNIWDTDALYPMNGTGESNGAEGTPSLEQRSLWLSMTYQFK